MNKIDHKLLMTTSERGTYIYDMRNLSKRLFTFDLHSGRVNCASWSPYNQNVFASAGEDRKVVIMDLSRIEIPRYSDDFYNVNQGRVVRFWVIF